MESSMRATVIFSTVGFLVNFGVGSITPILPLYAMTFGVSIALIGALISVSGLSRVVLDIPSGIVADRFGLKRFMMAGLLIVFASAMISALAVSYWMLLMGLMVQGADSAVFFTTSYIGISRTAPISRRGKHLGLFISLQFLGTTSGPILGGVVGQTYGLSGPFFVYALLVLISILVIHFMIGKGSVQRKGGRMDAASEQVVRSIRDYTLMSVNMGLLATSVLRTGLVATIVPLFATRDLGLGPATLGAVLTLSAAFNFLSLLPAGSLSDRYGRRPFFFASLFLGGVVAMIIPLAYDLATLMAVMSALGLCLGLSGPVGAYVTDVARTADLGGAMGLFRTMGDLGSFIGPIVLTLFLPQASGPIGSTPFIIAGFIVIGSSLLLLGARDPARERREKDVHRRAGETGGDGN